MLKQIRCFLEVANHLNFTKAAEKTYMTQQAVSRNISLLEEELGIRLLSRSTRSVVLTDAGRICRDEFTKLIDNYDNIVDYVKNISLANKSSVTIGFYLFLPRTEIIVPIMEMLHEKFVNVDFIIKLYDFVTLRQQLMDGHIDLCIALSSDWQYWPSVKVTALMKQPFRVVISKKHPLAASCNLQLKDLESYIWVAIDKVETIRPYPPNWHSKVPCKAKVPVGNFLSVLANIEAGHGFSCLTPVFLDGASNLKCYSLPFEDAFADFICVYREEMCNPLVLDIVKNITRNFYTTLDPILKPLNQGQGQAFL